LEAGIEVDGMSAGASTSITNELMLGHDSVATNARMNAQKDYSYSFSMDAHANLYSAMLKWNEVEVNYKDNFLSAVTKLNEALTTNTPPNAGAAAIFNFIREWGSLQSCWWWDLVDDSDCSCAGGWAGSDCSTCIGDGVTMKFKVYDVTTSDKLGVCEADCDTDDDCSGNLRCYAMPDNVQSLKTVPPGCSDPQPGYQHMAEGCVAGHNIVKYPSMTVQECADKCDDRSDCKAFEYGVDYRAINEGRLAPRDCKLQDSDDFKNCVGTEWNTDLYIKDSRFEGGLDYCYDPDACDKTPKEVV